MAPPSDTLDCRRDRVESSETLELDGVDTERSSRGMASRASDGEMLEDGESGRCIGDVALLVEELDMVLVVVSEWRPPIVTRLPAD